ncbi:MAG: chromosomal replication initiator protein DnaA [candidate division WOR-3 bacterium]
MEDFVIESQKSDAELLWEDILEILKTRLPESAFNTWFVKTKGVSFSGDRLIVEAPNTFWIEWIEANYRKLLIDIIKSLGKNFSVVFTPKPKADNGSDYDIKIEDLKNPPFARPNLNPRFTFESFIVGKSNEMAYFAAWSVAKNPGKDYNPLFLYGGVGLGKTHLLNAIGNYIFTKTPKAKAIIIRCEDLMNELIDSIQRRKTKDFRTKYRNVDLLLIDDIQFLQDKNFLQEELFHTFNFLFEKQKQIVMTSDRSPQQIYALEERLVSRFQWGLVVEITKPDFETRLAITRKKIEEERIIIPDDVVYFIAENIRDNVRSIEGALKVLKAYITLTKSVITVDKAKELLANFISPTYNVTMADLLKIVAQEFKLSVYDLKSKSRKKEIVLARQIAMYLARNVIGLSLTTIGTYFGGKDHTTVLHSIQKIEELKKDPRIEFVINEIHRKMKLL